MLHLPMARSSCISAWWFNDDRIFPGTSSKSIVIPEEGRETETPFPCHNDDSCCHCGFEHGDISNSVLDVLCLYELQSLPGTFELHFERSHGAICREVAVMKPLHAIY
jgi:hypothetical protein